ncbi:MAG TPA: hypothetical protein VHQ43_08760 [Solirubrobacterales bacterium]|jgi:hypothetical protein|nr:hypothetical protein [Solirubrobacterales bacterium]
MKVIEANQDEARSWTERWLGAGHALSADVLANAPFGDGRFRTCVSDDVTPERLTKFEEGNMARTKEADEWLAQTLDELTVIGASCLVVEDDLSRPTDPALIRSEIPSAFIGDRVVSWSDLSPGNGEASVKAVMAVGSGYPRNAFVVSQSAANLGLDDRQQVPEDFPSKVAESLLAVIVAIFDAESYLIWDRGDSLPFAISDD